MIDCLSDRPIALEFTPDRNVEQLLTPLTPTSSMNSAAQPNLLAIDFDPFIDGEIALIAPATESQQEIWLGVQLSKEANLACMLSQSLRLTGRLNLDTLQSAIRQLVSRHESLRMTFSGDGETILIAKNIEFEIPVIDLSGLDASDREVAIDRALQQAVREPFDLQHGPLFRTNILKLDDLDRILIFTIHHVICDGWSYGVILSDLAKIYANLEGSRSTPAQPEYFSDYAFLERAQIGSPEAIETEAYWLKQFADLPPILDLPTDYPRPPLRTFNSGCEYRTLPTSLVDKISQLGIKNSCSLMTTLLAAFEIFLFKLTGQTDLTVGVPTSGQIAAGKYDLVGHCVNFLPLRSRIDPECTFSEYLRFRNSSILDDYEHQNFTFGSLLQKLSIPRDASRIPLVSAVFNVDLDGIDKQDLFTGLTTKISVNRGAFATFEFFFNAVTTASGQLELDCQYNPNLFSAATIERRLAEFENLLTQIVETTDKSIHQLSLLSASAQHQLLVEWNQTHTDYPRSQSIDRLFEERVALAGDAVALVCAERQLTYSELNDRANRLANYLIAQGVKSGELVGIAMNRSIESIVAILAILKAGGAYLPLDLSYPADRLAFMLADANVSILLTKRSAIVDDSSSLGHCLPNPQARSIDLDTDWPEIATASSVAPQRSGGADALAYVMYTSGSTGQPKGVCVPHRGIVRLVKNTNYIDFSPSQVWLQLAPIAFDASTLEIWGSLLNGGKLVLFPGDKPSLAALGQIIDRHQITSLWLTAGLFHLMVDERIEDLRPLRQLIAGGDVLSVTHVQKVLSKLPDCQLINGYGPTENTTFTCCYPIKSLDGLNSVPIGRPIANTQVYILDADRQPVPIGIPGELYIGGDGLAQGYLNRPDLTLEKFIPNTFGSGQLYRTGDLVRYLPDGQIEFLGRIDNQVKIRGFRIELGEIDAVLSQHPSVREVRTIDLEDRSGDKRLVAYLVVDRSATESKIDWRSFLQSRLPDYLIPSAFVTVDALPLTANGKVDRRALPQPEIERQNIADTFVAPRNDLERQLVKIWERVLGVQQIGVSDNFFDLGGHSLMAVRLFNEIEKELGQKISLSTLFNIQTIAELAELFTPNDTPVTTWQSLVQIKSGDSTKSPLFCIHALWGNILFYRDFSQYLKTERSIYGLQSKGLDGEQKACDSIPEMAASYIKEIQSVQPQGPYLLLGFSLGGLIAFEIALQLQAQGQEIQMLTLIDPTCPNLPPSISANKTFDLDASLFTKVTHHLQALGKLGLEDKITYVQEKVHWNLTVGKLNFFYKIYLQYVKKSINELRQIDVVLANDLSRKIYIPDNTYSGKVIVLKAEDPGVSGDDDDSESRWDLLATEGIEIEITPGSHLNMMKEPNIRTLCAKFNYLLDRHE